MQADAKVEVPLRPAVTWTHVGLLTWPAVAVVLREAPDLGRFGLWLVAPVLFVLGALGTRTARPSSLALAAVGILLAAGVLTPVPCSVEDSFGPPNQREFFALFHAAHLGPSFERPSLEGPYPVNCAAAFAAGAAVMVALAATPWWAPRLRRWREATP